MITECAALKGHFSVTTAGYSPINDSEISFIELTNERDKSIFNFHLGLPKILRAPFTIINKFNLFLFNKTINYSKKDYDKLKKKKYDLIICHHPETLEMAFDLKKSLGSKIIFNAHEIYAYEFEENKEWMAANFEFFTRLLKQFLPKCENVFSVNEEIARFYEEHYSCKTTLVTNSKPYANIKVSQVSDPIRIIHHGGAMPQRKLEQMADAVLACGQKYKLTFMLANTNPDYLSKLKSVYVPRGVTFLDAVPFSGIVEEISKYDVGLYILPNNTINHNLALPNKVFEFVQARLALVTSPNFAMKNLIESLGIGTVATDFDALSMTKTLQLLDRRQIEQFKLNSERAALLLSSAEDEKRILNAVLDALRMNK